MLPFVIIRKQDGSLGVPTSPNPTGILAIIAPRSGPSGPSTGPSTPALQTKPSTILSRYGNGLLTEIASYTIPQTQKPVLLVPQDASNAATYGSVTYTGTGSASGNVTPGGTPLDDFDVTVIFTLGGTLGTGPINYQYSIDSRRFQDTAKVVSPVQQLGTGLVITIPTTGMTFTLLAGNTVVTGDRFTVHATGPRLSDADALTALTALGRTNLPWEAVLIEGLDASSSTVSNADTFLAGLEANGKFRMFITGARLRAQNGTETEAQYLTAMTTQWGSVASIRGCVTADGSFLTSAVRGIDMVRKTDIGFAAALMAIGVTTDAAEVDLGPVESVRIVDEEGNPVYHDEQIDPGLDDQRLVTYRTFANKVGVFFTNPKVISTPGSDYVFAQQIRTMNRACELAFGGLTDELSRGIFVNTQTGFIREDSAQALEKPINSAIRSEIGKLVPFVGFSLSRDDVLTPPTALLTGQIELIMPVYIKGFLINAKFIRTISVAI